MARQYKKNVSRKRRSQTKQTLQTHPVSKADLDRLEFHRHAAALMPDPKDKRPGVAILVEPLERSAGQQFCYCNARRSRTCPHLKDLHRIFSAYREQIGKNTPADDFKSSFWSRFAEVMADGASMKADAVRLAAASHGTEQALLVVNASGEQLLTYFSQATDRSRFLERCTVTGEKQEIPIRGDVISKLCLLTLTKDERIMMDRGFKSRRQTLEESFWYKVAYHCYREFSAGGGMFYPAIDKNTGDFFLQFKDAEKQCPFAVDIPRHRVKAVLSALNGAICNTHELAVDPFPLDAIFDVRLNENYDMEIQPLLRLIQKNGEAKFFERENLKRFQYGDLYYIEELGIVERRPGRSGHG